MKCCLKQSHPCLFRRLAVLVVACLVAGVTCLADPTDHLQPRQLETWWAFQPLSDAQVPAVPGSEGWVRNEIDRWILDTMQERGLSLNPRADRRTLIRRAFFILTGMPPTPEQVTAFEQDSSQNAWEKVVETLLDSPRYGERWGRHWLDVARFAESSGFEHDYDRPSAYHYRDFVIKALNADMPYHQFVRWQLAGDEYEPDNPLALMATGFLGAGVFPTQITANEVERVRYDAMDDMLSTTGAAFLGLTVGCARCHDHKTDPIPSEDYYRMLSTFTTTVRSEVELDLEPGKHQQALEVYNSEQAPLVSARKAYEETELPGNFDAWLKGGAPRPELVGWQMLEPSFVQSNAGAAFNRLEDGSYLVEGKNGDSDVYTFEASLQATGLRSLRLEALAHDSMSKGGPGRAGNGNIGLSRIRVFVVAKDSKQDREITLQNPRATFEQNNGNLSITASLDKDPKTGWAVDPQFGKDHAAVFDFAEPLTLQESERLKILLEFNLNTQHNIGRPRLSVSTVEGAGFDDETLPAEIATIFAKLAGSGDRRYDLSEKEQHALMHWWKHSDPEWNKLNAAVTKHAETKPSPELTKVLICAEGYPAVRMHTQGSDFFEKTFFLKRGSTDSKGEEVSQGFLRALYRQPDVEDYWRFDVPEGAKYSGRRRSLAEWLTDVDQGAGPLLARVMVNRIWQHHFGQGLVRTPNDFGVLGEPPEHPALLDWLAHRLIHEGWRLKPIHQLIMSSRTWQQMSGQPKVGQGESDQKKSVPGSFYPRQRRLEAEAIRDALLVVSGVLDDRMYGPGVLDAADHRRSIYLTVKRSKVINSMQAYDAPEPLVSQGTRPTTTVAPQALLLMNGPHIRDWARAFSERFAPDQRQSVYESVQRAYGMGLNREPSGLELAESAAFIAGQTERYRADGQANAERLALTDFAQIIMGLNEFIYVE